MTKYLIINADDFGASTGINHGILECYTRGVVTSTSLMVTGRAVTEAVSMSRDHPGLAVGLHWDVWGEEDERGFDINNVPAVRDEFHRQVEAFYRLLGRMPTHVDSHRHAHLRGELFAVFRELVEPLGVPLRYDSQVRCVASFYAQWEWMVTHLEYVNVPGSNACSTTRSVRDGQNSCVIQAMCHQTLRRCTSQNGRRKCVRLQTRASAAPSSNWASVW